MLNSVREYNRSHYVAKAIKLLTNHDSTEIGFILRLLSVLSLFPLPPTAAHTNISVTLLTGRGTQFFRSTIYLQSTEYIPLPMQL
jgi:hypothetical protein